MLLTGGTHWPPESMNVFGSGAVGYGTSSNCDAFDCPASRTVASPSAGEPTSCAWTDVQTPGSPTREPQTIAVDTAVAKLGILPPPRKCVPNCGAFLRHAFRRYTLRAPYGTLR